MEWKTFYIKKNGGGRRKITAPDKYLKKKQKKILKELYKLYYPYYELINANGGIPFRNIIKHADKHQNKEIVMRLDIKDFFDNIDTQKLIEMLKDDLIKKTTIKKEGVNVVDMRKINGLLKRIENCCFYDNRLPQGAVTSPFLANIYLKNFDFIIWKLAKGFCYDYSRYFDDMVFSTDIKKMVTKKLEGKYYYYADFKQIIKAVENYLKKYGLRLNYRKTKIMRKAKRQSVCNVTVNQKININRKYYKMLRAVKHRLLSGKEATMTMQQYLGHLSFVHSVNKETYDKLMIGGKLTNGA